MVSKLVFHYRKSIKGKFKWGLCFIMKYKVFRKNMQAIKYHEENNLVIQAMLPTEQSFV